MATLAFSAMEDLVVVVYGAKDPSNADIEEVVGVFKKLDMSRIPSLIVSHGGAPNALQREMLLTSIGTAEHLSAVMSDSLRVRGVVTALSWFKENIKAFSKSKLGSALEYLNISPSRNETIAKEIDRLEHRVGLTE